MIKAIAQIQPLITNYLCCVKMKYRHSIMAAADNCVMRDVVFYSFITSSLVSCGRLWLHLHSLWANIFICTLPETQSEYLENNFGYRRTGRAYYHSKYSINNIANAVEPFLVVFFSMFSLRRWMNASGSGWLVVSHGRPFTVNGDYHQCTYHHTPIYRVDLVPVLTYDLIDSSNHSHQHRPLGLINTKIHGVKNEWPLRAWWLIPHINNSQPCL